MRDDCGSAHIHTTPACSTCKLAILVRCEQAHLLPIKFAQAADDDGTVWHQIVELDGELTFHSRAEWESRVRLKEDDIA